MASYLQNTQPQPQVVQLESNFAAPAIAGYYFDTITQATQYAPHFPKKVIWSVADSAFYYLAVGDGSNSTNWKIVGTKTLISMYNAALTYQKDEPVYLSSKIFVALLNVPVNVSPLDNDEYWLQISGGNSESFRYIFQNATSILIYTEVRNPIFDVWLGDIVLDGQGNVVIDSETGLASFENVERVRAIAVRRDDIPNNNGKAYQIYFYENSILVQKTGFVNIK